jgi:Domain of Unknown Function (DUF326)
VPMRKGTRTSRCSVSLAATNAYLSEDTVAALARCIRICMDCADICDTTAQVLTRHTGYDANTSRALLGACAMARKSRGDECARHASMHEHCRICAETCRRCEQACRHLIAAMS